ncbi:MAG: helix-hairpin-helix domain-containing protein [Oscillospiraceae bacterium]|nr:helix-hairpin-helix domain-containing protein [Oscillospiraceae bacterium]
MNSQERQLRILISIACILCSFVIFYNIFFVPEIAAPTVVYIDKNEQTVENREFSEEHNEMQNEKININLASEEELSKLPGIGNQTAKKIIEKRKEINNFKSIENIKEISGIGEKKFERIKNLICV